MSLRTTSPDGIVVVFSRPSDFAQEATWDEWYRDEHLPTTAKAAGATAATRWENTDRPHMAVSPVGFTHVAIYEFDDVASGGPKLLDLFDKGPKLPIHSITAVEVMRSAGAPWNHRLEPSPEITGQVIAFVGPAERARDAEWNEWLNTIHIPDMVDSGAFANASRWVRTQPARFGPNYLTVYDVTLSDINEAVGLSGAAMAPAREKGRLLDVHAGGLRASLVPA